MHMTTVKELITLLLRYNPESEVWLADIKTGKPYRGILEFKQTRSFLLIHPDPNLKLRCEEVASDNRAANPSIRQRE
jgi:hypothetical protein